MLEQPTLLGLVIEPTIAMRRGEQLVFQCSECGLIAVQTDIAPGPLAACPACSSSSWWEQSLPVAGLNPMCAARQGELHCSLSRRHYGEHRAHVSHDVDRAFTAWEDES